MGRKANPKNLKLVQGNPGKRPINENEPEFETVDGSIEAPSWLTPPQVEFWNELAPMLAAAKVLTAGDVPALASLCIALGELKYANEQCQVSRLMKTQSGFVQQSPFVGMLNTAIKQIRSLTSEFGMTPAARTRVMVLAGLGTGDAFAAFASKNAHKKKKA